MKKIIVSIFILSFVQISQAALRVVTTTSDLMSITQDIGKDLVEVNSIAKGYQDPHFVEAKPSYLLKMRNADLFIQIGLELEVAWAPSLLTNARNPKILPGQPGFLEVSSACDILQKTEGRVDRSMGDVHPFGNPHFWLDPENGRKIAQSIAAKLSELDPAHSDIYKKNLSDFESRLTAKEKDWESHNAHLKGMKVVTYHNSWPNFTKRFGLDVVNFVEPKPGIPASPAHVQELIDQIKREKIQILLVEPYFDTKLPEKIARDTGSKLVIFPPSVGADEKIKNYFDLFDYDLQLLNQNISGGLK